MTISIDTDGAPCIMLGGRQWPVPLLAARQNKVIDPLILSLLPIFAQWQSDKASALAQLGSVQYDALQEIAFQALRRAHPAISREEFLELPVTLPELVGAFSVIAHQTGIFQRAPSGEAEAGSARTGTELSPMSAI